MAENRVTEDEVRVLGWNSIIDDNPRGAAMVLAQQLNLIGLLLLDIRDRLDEVNDAD